MLRLLFTRRWLGYLALTVVFAVVASLFGLWQWDRRGQAVAAMDLVANNFDRAPVELEPLLMAEGILGGEYEWVN